jgi:hypothetical protein
MAGESHAFALNASIPHDSLESSSILPSGDFVTATRNGGEQIMHDSLESGADMLPVLPGCSIGARTGESELRRTPRCSLLPFQCLPMNIGDIIIGLESVDIPYRLREDFRCRPLRSATARGLKKKSAYRLNSIVN